MKELVQIQIGNPSATNPVFIVYHTQGQPSIPPKNFLHFSLKYQINLVLLQPKVNL